MRRVGGGGAPRAAQGLDLWWNPFLVVSGGQRSCGITLDLMERSAERRHNAFPWRRKMLQSGGVPLRSRGKPSTDWRLCIRGRIEADAIGCGLRLTSIYPLCSQISARSPHHRTNLRTPAWNPVLGSPTFSPFESQKPDNTSGKETAALFRVPGDLEMLPLRRRSSAGLRVWSRTVRSMCWTRNGR